MPRLTAAAAERTAEEWAATEQYAALRLARLRLSLCGALERSAVAATLCSDAMRAEPRWNWRRSAGCCGSDGARWGWVSAQHVQSRSWQL